MEIVMEYLINVRRSNMYKQISPRLACEFGIYSIEHRFMVKDPVHLVFLKR